MTPVQILNSAGLNSKNIVNSVSIVNDNSIINRISENSIGMNNVSCEYFRDEW